MSCIPNAYTTLCTTTIYRLISGLESLQLPVYQDFILDQTHASVSYFAIFPIAFAASSYIIVQSVAEENTIRFWSVNMNENNVLTANYETFNVIPGLLMNYRTKTYLKYKNKSFEFRYSVPFIDQLVNTKQLIQNLFNETMKSFVLYDTIVMQFVRIDKDSYYRFAYVGLLGMTPGGLFVDQKTDFDFANGTLVGMIDKKPFMLYNRFGMQTINLYPFSNYIFSPLDIEKNYSVIGGLNNYFLGPDQLEVGLWKTNFMYELQYQASFLPSDSSWGYQPLADQIPIPSTCQFIPPYTGPSFIMAFNNHVFPTFVILGSTQFYNTENTIITSRLPIRYSEDASEYDWTVYPLNGPPAPSPCPSTPPPFLYYVVKSDQMIIYTCTMQAFLDKYKGFISIEDLDYSIERNQLYIQNRESDWRPYGSTPDRMHYNHGYRHENWYFKTRNSLMVNNDNGLKENQRGLHGRLLSDISQITPQASKPLVI